MIFSEKPVSTFRDHARTSEEMTPRGQPAISSGCAVRARFVDDVGQILSQEFERRVDGEAEMAREFLRLRIAENGLELIFSNRKIGARCTWALSPPFCSAATRPLRSRYCVL